MKRVVAAALALALAIGALFAVRAYQEHRSDQSLKSVIADAHELRSAILGPYPRGLATMKLEQRGRFVDVVSHGVVLDTVEFHEGNKVVDWTPAPINRPGWPFVFCVEHDNKEWARYHSNDGVVRKTGRDGSCEVPDYPGINVRYPCPRPWWSSRDVRDDRAEVYVRWGRLNRNRNPSYTRWIDVYDGERKVARVSPWDSRVTIARFPRAAGYDEDLTFESTNGKPDFDSVGCRPISIRVPAEK